MQQLLNDLALADGHRAADGRIQLLMKVDPQGVQEGGMDIFDAVRVADVLLGIQ